MEQNKGKLVELKAYDDKWLIAWCKKELMVCQQIERISCCEICKDYGACLNDPLRVIRNRLAEKEPVVVEVKDTRFNLVS